MVLCVFELLKVSLNQYAPPPTCGIESTCFLKRTFASGLCLFVVFVSTPLVNGLSAFFYYCFVSAMCNILLSTL